MEGQVNIDRTTRTAGSSDEGYLGGQGEEII